MTDNAAATKGNSEEETKTPAQLGVRPPYLQDMLLSANNSAVASMTPSAAPTSVLLPVQQNSQNCEAEEGRLFLLSFQLLFITFICERVDFSLTGFTVLCSTIIITFFTRFDNME